MKQGDEHIPFLDHLRGVAILTVFCFHALELSAGQSYLKWYGWFRFLTGTDSPFAIFPAAFGWLGVPMFFAISGFCIHLSHQRSRYKGFKVFFLRRFFRIYPPYFAALILVIASIVVTDVVFRVSSVHGTTLSEVFTQTTPHLFLIHNFSARYADGINSALWSVAVEVQLYLLYPLLLWWAKKWDWMKVLWITASIELGLRSVEALLNFPYPGWVLPKFCTGSPFYYWFSWAMGAALADAYLKRKPLPFRNAFVFAWPLLFIGCFFFLPFSFYGFTLAALSTTALMAFGLGPPIWEPVIRGWGRYPIEHLRQAGIVSYSAYLLHVPLLSQTPRLVRFVFHHQTILPEVMFGICLAVWLPVFGLSCLFYKFVELPSIAWGKRIISRQEAVSATESALKTTPLT